MKRIKRRFQEAGETLTGWLVVAVLVLAIIALVVWLDPHFH
jgi:hypothetical protein